MTEHHRGYAGMPGGPHGQGVPGYAPAPGQHYAPATGQYVGSPGMAPALGTAVAPGASLVPGGPRPPTVEQRRLLRGWLWVGAYSFIAMVGALLVLVLADLEMGPTAVVMGLLAALLPPTLVVPAFLWLDRFEPEPGRWLAAAFVWGACVATAGAVVINGVGDWIVLQLAGAETASFLSTVVGAPLAEESLKGLGVLLIFLLLRRSGFDGIIDGIVYAGITAAGFAFVENILYLGGAFGQRGSAGLLVLLVIRGGFGAFAHPLFTCCTGLGLGIAASGRGGWRYLMPIVGWLCAVTLHGLWNLGVTVDGNGLLVYVFVEMPIFLLAVGFAVWARRREGRVIATHLQGYVAAGWFSPAEVTMLANLRMRRIARHWAKGRGGHEAVRDMRSFQDHAIELAMLRQRMNRGGARPDAPARELVLLDQLVWLRTRLYGVA